MNDDVLLKRLKTERTELYKMLRKVEEQIKTICNRCDHTWVNIRSDNMYSDNYYVCKKCDIRK